jgi:hypothetical protein
MVRGLGQQARGLLAADRESRSGRPTVVQAAILRNRLEVRSFNPQQMTSVAERANNPRLHVPEVALLCVGARQLVRPLLRRHDDPLLTQ